MVVVCIALLLMFFFMVLGLLVHITCLDMLLKFYQSSFDLLNFFFNVCQYITYFVSRGAAIIKSIEPASVII